MIISSDNLTALWADQKGSDLPFRILAIRAALEAPGAANRETVYDDLMILHDSREGTFTVWLASVDPSWPLIENPINPDGAAQLMPGVWMFERGIHKENPAHPCLVQTEDFKVWRLYTDGTIITRVANGGIDTGDFGIHLHSGGPGQILGNGVAGMPLASTCNFSAGCQIVHNGDGYFCDPTWGKFIQPVYAKMAQYGQTQVPYWLSDNTFAPTGLEFTGLVLQNPVIP